MPDTPDLDPPVPETDAPDVPFPEITPNNSPEEAPQTSPLPGDSGAGRSIDAVGGGSTTA